MGRSLSPGGLGKLRAGRFECLVVLLMADKITRGMKREYGTLFGSLIKNKRRKDPVEVAKTSLPTSPQRKLLAIAWVWQWWWLLVGIHPS